MDIRPFTGSDQDYAAFVHIKNSVWEQLRFSVEQFKAIDEKEKMNPAQRFLGYVDEVVVASGMFQWDEESTLTGCYSLHVEILPRYEGLGYGTEFYTFLWREVGDYRPQVIKAVTHKSKPHAIRFLEKNGFQKHLMEVESRLDVAQFDFARYADIEDTLQTHGINIITLSELRQRDPEWKEHWWELNNELLPDVPRQGGFTSMSFEQFEREIAVPFIHPDGVFFALADGELVGVTSLHMKEHAPELLENSLTGVLPIHRRLGVATALKVRGIQFAKDYGATTIMTINEENNPMLQLNISLGFQPVPAWVHYTKDYA